MDKGNGIITKVITWVTHPYYGNETILEWTAGLALILAVSFLWSTVVKDTIA